jgi:hypothetical protein
MRLARLAALTVAFTMLAAAGADAATWTPAATLATCAPASDPVVAFPFSEPSTRSGRGAIMWIGGAPDCGGTGRGPTSTLDSATLHTDDLASIPRAVVSRRQLVGPLETATTTAGQLVAVAGDPADAVGGRPGALLGEGLAGGVLPVAVPLGGPDSPVATADGYIGDADVVSTETSLGGEQLILLREQRHYARAFAPAITLEEGFAPITALSVGMDFRGDSIVLWAQGGVVHAQWVTNDGDIYAAQTLGPAGYAPALAAVLSDNNHAFVMWTDEPPPGRPGEARIFLEHSGNNVALPVAPQLLLAFAEPAAQRLGPDSIALARVTPSEGVLAAWTLIANGNYEVQAAGLTSSQVLPAATITEPGVDLRLAALATGPENDYVAVLESAPRSPSGFDTSQQAILAARSTPGGPGGVAFETPTQLAAAGFNSDPSVAIDPDSDRAVVAWQTVVGGLPAVAYAVRTGP